MTYGPGSISQESTNTINNHMSPFLPKNETVECPALQWPINILTKEPDCVRTCKRVWIACLSPLLTVPVYDMKDNLCFVDEDDTSTIATLDDEFVAECSSHLKYRAHHLVQKILRMSDSEWRKGYIPIVYEITQLQASVDPQLALDMARMGLTAINTSIQLRGADARKTIMDRMVHGPEGSWMFSTCVVHGELNYIETITKTSSRRTQNESNTENNKQSDESTIKSSTTGPQSRSPHDNTMEDASMKKCEKSKSGMRRQPATPFQMGAPRGPNGEAPPHPFLTGPQIREQLIAWAKYGCIEPSVVSSVGKVASYSDATSFVQAKNTIFVLLGATSELGPFDVLSRLGANIAIVSRPGYLTKIQKLVYDAKYKSNCTLYLPVRPRYANVNDIDAESSHCYQEEEYLSTNYMSFESATLTREMGDELGDALDRAGADIITDTPELIEWILNLVKFNPESSDQLNENPDTSAFNRTESGEGSNESVPLTDNRKRLVICNMASLLVPEDQVLVTAGMDLICETVCRYHRNTSLVYYISPNTAHCVSEDASRDSEQRHLEAPLWQKVLQAMPTNMTFQPQGSWPKMPNTGLRVSNGIAGYKGHYYTLSKTSQIWRAMLAKSEGHIVSANLGPSSRTDSMISFKFIRFALEGMQIVPPFVAFDVEPAKTLMAALMLYDLNCDQSTAHPYVRQKHPMCLFLENAVHGGTWRCPFTVDSMGQVSYVVGHFRKAGRSPLNSLSWKEWQGGLPSFIDGYHPKEHDENDCKESIVGSSYTRGSSKLFRRKSARSQS